MKKTIVVLLAVIFLSACASKGKQMTRLANENSQNITQLKIGMSYSAVMSLMGTKSVYSLSNPMRTESFISSQGRNVQVLYYCTLMGHFGRCYERDVTPVVLQNGRVTGWGRKHLGSLSQATGRFGSEAAPLPAETEPAAPTTPAPAASPAPAPERAAPASTPAPTIRR